MSYVRIPLDNTPNSVQSFKVTLDGGERNVHLTLRLRYFDLYNYWMADVVDNTTKKELICGLPLVPGENLLEQYQYLAIGNAAIVAVSPTDLYQPDNTTLGSTFVLVWGDAS